MRGPAPRRLPVSRPLLVGGAVAARRGLRAGEGGGRAPQRSRSFPFARLRAVRASPAVGVGGGERGGSRCRGRPAQEGLAGCLEGGREGAEGKGGPEPAAAVRAGWRRRAAALSPGRAG